MRIGITGATGVLGKNFVRLFGKKDQLLAYPGRIENKSDILDWLKKYRPQAIMHFASLVPTVTCEREPVRAVQTNVLGTTNLLEAVREAVPKSWIFVASTCHVYRSSRKKITESFPVDPISFYGFTKLQQEQIALEFSRRWGLQVCIGRLFSFSGVGQPSSYFIPKVIQTILAAPKNSALVFKGGGNKRDFLDVRDVAIYIKKLLAKKYCGIVNISSGKKYSIEEVVRQIAKACGRNDLKISIERDPSPSIVVGSNQKLKKLVGTVPQFNIKALVQDIVQSSSR